MKLGLLSFAHIHAEAYAHHLRHLPGVEFLGIADDDAVRGQDAAHRYGARFFPTYAELLAEQPDGVVVCSENARHRPLVEMAAQSGAHILCEKPLATTLADAQAMVEVCERAGVLLMTAFPMRFSAALLEIKALIDRGGLGFIHACTTTNQGQLPRRYRQWFVDKALAGGGSATDHVVHLADALRWLLGQEVTEVYAQLNRIIHSEVEVETGGLVMLTFGDGTFASIDCSWSRPANWPTWGGLTMNLIGDKAVVEVDAFRQNLAAFSNRPQHPEWLAWGSDADRAMLLDFVAAIRDRRPPLVGGLDGLRAVEIVQAVYCSADAGHPVALPLA
ncbi:MAG: Gfo/Idh/MocA family oxidoreductase [Caldilineales bacterium]|nr:Gfo/Idh/MocA family oxidoreductase [Caldilineales bacterium]MCW5856753.1 Gfo/Idh/MocA family oxidoreductase [Caldilineales bacterium]